MKPRGPLMIEHRLIEKMIGIINDQITLMEKNQTVDPVLIDTIVDFIKTYADRTHHGKEEDILFRDLEGKNMSESDTRIMKELVEEHQQGRKLVADIVAAKQSYLAGDMESLTAMIKGLKELAAFYPEHIKKEDAVFFPGTEKYFTNEELDAMLEEFWTFDRSLIHEKYKNVVEQIRAKAGL